jgi:hypothetical protein
VICESVDGSLGSLCQPLGGQVDKLLIINSLEYGGQLSQQAPGISFAHTFSNVDNSLKNVLTNKRKTQRKKPNKHSLQATNFDIENILP